MVEALQAAVTTQLIGLKEFHVVQHCLVREREIPECSDVVGEVLVAVEKMLALKFPVVAAECSVVVGEFPAFVVQVLLEEVPVVVEQSHLDA